MGFDIMFPYYDKETGIFMFVDQMGCPLSYNDHLEIKKMLDVAVLHNSVNLKELIDKKVEEFNNKYFNNKERIIREKHKRKIIQGYVYIVKLGNHFKIGKAKDMKSRMGEYTKLPIEPEIVFLKKVADHTLAEETLHNYFADKHGRGEWFNLNDEDIKIADSLV